MGTKGNVLISVADKTGVGDMARRFSNMGCRIISSGGTAEAIAAANVPVTSVENLLDEIFRTKIKKAFEGWGKSPFWRIIGGEPNQTKAYQDIVDTVTNRIIESGLFNNGAILDDRVKTLRPEIHAGLIADLKNPKHVQQLQDLLLPVIDVLVVDFYALAQAIAKPGADLKSVLEFLDIGGPAMVRSAAKGRRIVICRVQDREWVLNKLEDPKKYGEFSQEDRDMLCARAEFEVTNYCLESAKFQGKGKFEGFTGELFQELAYGEGKTQKPARHYSLWNNDNPLALHKATIEEGSTPSYINKCDQDRVEHALRRIAVSFKANGMPVPYICLIAKHCNACGAGVSWDNPITAIKRAASGDTLSSFGGMVVCNFKLTEELSEALVSTGMSDDNYQKFDGVYPPAFSKDAMEIFKRPKSKCRMYANAELETKSATLSEERMFRQVEGGFLVQPPYSFVLMMNHPELKVIGQRNPKLEKQLIFAAAVCAESNSNTITLARDFTLVGQGICRPSRVGAAKVAIMAAADAGHAEPMGDPEEVGRLAFEQAQRQSLVDPLGHAIRAVLRSRKPRLKPGTVAVSDSFPPHPDAIIELLNAGVSAIFATYITVGKPRDLEIERLCREKEVPLYQLPDEVARMFCWH